MSKRVILITNTAPFYGEVFLQNELNRIPCEQEVILFPILAEDMSRKNAVPSNVRVVADACSPGMWDKLLAVVHGIAAPVIHKDMKAIFSAQQPLRNLLKAVKFAAVAQSRGRLIRRWLRRNCPGESFVFYSYWLYEAGYVAARLKKMFPGSSFVSRCHGYDLYKQRHANGYMPFRHDLLTAADRIWPVSENGVAYLRAEYPFESGEKVCAMRLGTADHGICAAQATDRITLVSCSNLVDVKRVDKIVEALALLEKPAVWHHFGDGPLMEKLLRQANGLPEHIRWIFHGNVPNQQLMEFYRTNHVDCFLNVSASEGVPVSIMEAMSFGIPVIATDVGGTAELVVHNENGFLLAADFRAQTLADRIWQLCPERGHFGKNSRARWEQLCSAETNYREFYAAIRQL